MKEMKKCLIKSINLSSCFIKTAVKRAEIGSNVHKNRFLLMSIKKQTYYSFQALLTRLSRTSFTPVANERSRNPSSICCRLRNHPSFASSQTTWFAGHISHLRFGLLLCVRSVFPKVCSADNTWSARLAQVARQCQYKSIFWASRTSNRFLVVCATKKFG